MEKVTKSISLNFRGNEFLIDCKVDSQGISLRVEEKDSGKQWKGEFTAEYIQDITFKTGNAKKFPVFVKMLLTALENQSESVFVDLLTYQDLEMLKSRRTQSSNPPNPKLLHKKYLILTYTVEFDRVHYPLPLIYEESPDPESQLKTIERMKEEISKVKKLLPANNLGQVIKENEELRQKIKTLSFQKPPQEDQRLVELMKEKEQLDQENQALKLEGSSEVRQLKKLNQNLNSELDKVREEMDQIIEHLESQSEERNEVGNIKKKVNLLMQELEKTRKSESKYNQEKTKLEQEIQKLKTTEEKQTARIKQLQQEINDAKKAKANSTKTSPANRSPASSRQNTPPNRSRGNSFNRRNSPYGPGIKASSPRQNSPGAWRRNSPQNSKPRQNSPSSYHQRIRQNSPKQSPARNPPSQRNPRFRNISPRVNTNISRERDPVKKTTSSPGNPRVKSSPKASPQRKPQYSKPSPQRKCDTNDIDSRLARIQKYIKDAKY